MGTHQQNIVQVELFHVGLHIKTEFRFYDKDRSVTKFMEIWVATQRRYDKLLQTPISATVRGRIYSKLSFKYLAYKMDTLRNSQVSLIALCIKKLMRSSGDLAIGCMDYSFRRATSEERQELLKTIPNSTQANLLLMGPNDLLSDSQHILADIFLR